ncbi:MAG: sulfatase [Deltaproteobacteria bacterium]|nr:sulfatase [Deltaproteobacteria bacterium]
MKNVVLITLDACRKDVFGAYGNPNRLTPFMDSLADKSIRFTNVQAIGPYTQASFPGILTSSYYLDFGWHKQCPPERVLVSEVLKKSGVATAAFHSNPYLSGYFGWNRGWDLFMDSMQDRITPKVPFLKGDKVNQRAEAWLSSRAKDKNNRPFFLWIHYMDVHEPYIPPPKYLQMVNPALDLNDDEMFGLFKEVVLKRDVSDPENIRVLKQLYDAHVREVDDYVKEFFSILEKLALLEDTAVILTSDHGDEFNEHGGLSHDSTMYSELVDVPLLIYEPHRAQGETCDQLISNVDIPPTITHLMDVHPHEKWAGRSILPISEYYERGCFGEAIGKKGQGEVKVKTEVHYYREGNLKIIYREAGDIWEMYDLDKDPGEGNNVVSKSAQFQMMKSKVIQRLRRAEKWAEEAGS